MKIIITGASSGIGQYLADYYEHRLKHDVLRVSRRHGLDVTKDYEKLRKAIGEDIKLIEHVFYVCHINPYSNLQPHASLCLLFAYQAIIELH